MSSRISVLLIDALNIIRRIFETLNGAPEPEIVDKTTRSSVSSVRRALRENNATHCLVVFEGEGTTWRHALYPAYKQNRKKAPEALARIIEAVREELSGIGVYCLGKKSFEADDVIASVAARLDSKDVRVTILSNDKDFLQLLSDNVTVRNHFARPGETAVRDRRWLEEKYGVPHRLFIDAMALIGDSSDNIPGVDGIGPKKAARLLKQWGDLDRLVENRGWIKGVVGRNLRGAGERLELSRILFTLKTDIELGLTLRDIRLSSSAMDDSGN